MDDQIFSEYFSQFQICLQLIREVVERLKIRQANDSPENTVTEQYDFIRFTDNELDETTRLSQFIHLALKTDAETVVQFMKEAWCLPTPDLIISITGGAKHFDLSIKLKKAFQMGLVSVATTTNAWIITAGTNAGVVKEVGEALNKYRYKNRKNVADIPCIGIGSWGYTAGNEQLDGSLSTTRLDSDVIESKTNRRHVAIDTLQLTRRAEYGIRTYIVKQHKKGMCDLEPNHTHFLLFDDGAATAATVLALRAAIENCSRRSNKEETIEGAIQTLIPIVMVLVEGGQSSTETICNALRAETPIVVVKESGRAADLIADLHACFSKDIGEDSTGRDKYHNREIDTIFAKAKRNNPWVDDVRETLSPIIYENYRLITIFNFDDQRYHGKLEEAILEAVFNAAKFSHENNKQYQWAAELRLALAWHNIDYARRMIFTDRVISEWQDENLRQGLVDALRRGYSDFIELFIEYGVTFGKLTVKDLEYLYATASIDKILPLKDRRNIVPTRDKFYKQYMGKYFKIDKGKNGSLGDHAIRDLFFWAIFHDRFDFATYLCSKVWNQSAALLFGARIYRKAAKIALNSEKKHIYKKNADKFDGYAASVIDRCFESDRDFAINIIQRPAAAFNNIYPLKIAARAKCRVFLASPCVQKYLDKEWFRNINYKRQYINIRIFLCSLFFPLLPLLCTTLPYLHRRQPFNPNAILQTKNSNAPSHSMKNTSDDVRCIDKIQYFYRAPIVRFYYNLIFFFVFLALFSYVLLVDYYPLGVVGRTCSGIRNLPIPITEICLHICVLGIIIEEFRQFLLVHSLIEYLSDISNAIDLTAIALYLIGFITRFIVTEKFFKLSKIVLGLDLILWYIRILHLFAAYERLGPKLIMIFNTMKDFLFFVCFILIFLFGFSIASWALITTSSQIEWKHNASGDLLNITIIGNGTNGMSWKLVRDITNYGVWKVFGQVDNIDDTNPYSAVAFVLAILFVAISNVLLLNVLIALFNVTIQNVRDRSHEIWRYQRFLLIDEFRKKSLLPPPFNIIYRLIRGIYCLMTLRQRRNRNYRSIDTGETSDQHLEVTEMMKRESAIAEDFWRDLFKQTEEKTK